MLTRTCSTCLCALESAHEAYSSLLLQPVCWKQRFSHNSSGRSSPLALDDIPEAGTGIEAGASGFDPLVSVAGLTANAPNFGDGFL